MSFKGIRGQDSAISLLKRSIANGRVAHAYIFLGPSGVGKFTTALAFAQALNCAGAKAGEGCGVCAPCRKILKSNHPDVLAVRPEKDSTSIKIDQMRELIRNISLRPYEGKRKVYVIDGAEAMTPETSNALLKTLEEPPPDSVLILVAENLENLFSTVVSRSQVVRFFPLGADAVKAILMKEYGVDEEKARVLSRLSSGRLGEALRYAEGKLFDKRTRLIDSLIAKGLFDTDFDGVSRDEMRLYLDIMLTWFRDILVYKELGTAATLVNIDRKEAVSRAAANLSSDYLCDAIRRIIETLSYLDQNANQKLAVAALGMRLS
ncbi:MAG: DNA polymerase III subunit delta' [Candidatus Omnitrophica bacterium]|nr:DNA polymerase III subunit delta' [Candidatus Omnitrophota bacterium]